MVDFLTESNLGKAMGSMNLWVNIAQTILFIGLGFLLTKKKKLPEETGKVLTKFVMVVCLPCLAFCSFMSDFSKEATKDVLVNFIAGFILYMLFIGLGWLVFSFVKDKEKKKVLAVLFAFGSTTFFGYPLVVSIYGANAGNDFNLMNIAYRVGLYSYAYLAISGTKVGSDSKSSVSSILKKVFLNPIVLATLGGLLLWALQGIPAVNTVPVDLYSGATSATKVAFWRFDVTLPFLFKPAKTLGSLSSPIILFAIGCTLGKTSLAEAARDKYAWIYSGLKVFVLPAIVLGLLFAVEGIAKACGTTLISADSLHSMVFTFFVPPATVAVGYCIAFDKEKEMASHISLISTLVAVFGIIFWVLILTLVDSSGFFVAA
ncbi:MAG: AEC family transporter [Bacilli bacterium]|jgi:predicted permease